MKNANRARIVIAVSAALGMAAMSSSASAQMGDWNNCAQYADAVCSFDENFQPIPVTYWCWHAEFDACIEAFSPPAAPPLGDGRSEVQPD